MIRNKYTLPSFRGTGYNYGDSYSTSYFGAAKCFLILIAIGRVSLRTNLASFVVPISWGRLLKVNPTSGIVSLGCESHILNFEALRENLSMAFRHLEWSALIVISRLSCYLVESCFSNKSQAPITILNIVFIPSAILA